MIRSVFNSITAYQRNIINIDKFVWIGFTLNNLPRNPLNLTISFRKDYSHRIFAKLTIIS